MLIDQVRSCDYSGPITATLIDQTRVTWTKRRGEVGCPMHSSPPGLGAAVGSDGAQRPSFLSLLPPSPAEGPAQERQVFLPGRAGAGAVGMAEASLACSEAS